MKYETVIGLEVHAELSTESKVFCSCSTKFGSDVNTNCCPVCTGMPGVLPVLNKKAVEYAVMAGLALNCDISQFSKMDRKNYYYPDLPKAYQISQYDLPLCKDGYLDIEVDGKTKRIRINRIHLEEDAGKLVHDEWGSGTLVDYNRCGVPLIEIVTEPDMRSPEEAKEFLEKLKSIIQYTEVSDCKMQEGSLRCDVNLSIREEGSEVFGVRTEMKNLNSFSGAYRAMIYERDRQIEVIEEGGTIKQETRRWDDETGRGSSMRSKEEAHDYRYFPDPDLVPIIISDEWKNELHSRLPELPEKKRTRYIEKYQLPEYDAGVLTSSKHLAEYFEGCLNEYNNPKAVSNWVMGNLMSILNKENIEFENIPLSPLNLAKLLKLIEQGTISGTIAKSVFEEIFYDNKDPESIVEKKGLKQISNEDELLDIVKGIIEDNPKSVDDFKAGKKKAIGYLVGQTMKATKGKANPKLVNQILAKELAKK